ncbi:MAG: MFS transporter, partial [Mesorhizobium sp.]
EGSQTHIELTSAMPFVMIFLTAGITLVLALVTLALMPEKPLRGHDEHAAPVLAE